MFKKMAFLVSLVQLLVLLTSASAQIMWDDGGTDSLWTTAENWGGDTIPGSIDSASIDQPPDTHCVIQAGIDAECETLRVGNGGLTTNLDITGGSLTAGGAYIGVDSPGGHGILNMSGGLFSTGDVHVGLGGTGTINMTGGVIELSSNLIVPGGTGTGTVHLRGGTINASDLRLTSAKGLVDVGAGTLVLEGDDTETLQTFIDDGWLVAYGGQGTLHVDHDVTNAGKTTITATPLLAPTPADGSLVSPGELELSWTLPDPCVPGEPVLVDVYFTNDLALLESFSEAILIVSGQSVSSVVVQADSKTQYYWAVDVYVGSDDDPIFGPIFTFLSDNLVPQADAGADIATWLEGDTRIGALDATITDDGAVMPYTVKWTVVSEPNEGDAVIEAPTAEDTNVTLAALGEYVFQLAAFDGEYIGTDTVTINVYSDSCAAAQSLPDYVPLVGDLNGDCRVDELDMALLEENWMQDNSLTEDWYELD
jgi:hypothetical protein